MFLCVDVHYSGTEAVAAGVVFKDIESSVIYREYIEKINKVHDYIPGQFYKRELPVLLAVINTVHEEIHTIIVDGYVWLSDDRQPGLGWYLYSALEEKIPVIGVAKSEYKDISGAIKIYRGRSNKPLYVTSAGLPENEAIRLIKMMHGDFRIPTLLKYVDNLARKSFPP